MSRRGCGGQHACGRPSTPELLDPGATEDDPGDAVAASDGSTGGCAVGAGVGPGPAPAWLLLGLLALRRRRRGR